LESRRGLRIEKSAVSGRNATLIIRFLTFLSLIFVIPQLAFSLKEDKFTPIRLDKAEIRIDGRLDEAVWHIADPIKDWYQQCPNEGKEPSETTEMWFLYDRDALYVGARLHVRATSTIISRYLERDSHKPDQDAVGLILDTLNDKRTAYGFIVTPSGVRSDIAVFNDAEGSEPPPWNLAWDAFWEAAAVRNENGWIIELRVPFDSLRLRTRDDNSADAGIILWRYIAHTAEYDVFPAIPNNWSFSAYKPSQALDVKFEGIKTSHPLYIKPYILGVLNQQYIFSGDLLSYRPQNSWGRDAGFDIKYNLSPNFILDVTLNTDFAQVEADDQQINLTRFSLFFPEKRSFFQERSDLFSFRIPGGEHTLFHSRSIGIVDEHPVPILGGARLTGRMGNWEMGFIEMQTGEGEVDGEIVPSENFGVFRLKRHVAPDGSYVGCLFTMRTDLKEARNFLVSTDADIRLKGSHYIRTMFAQSAQPGSQSSKSLMATIVSHSLIRKGLSYAISATHIGTQFNPGLGFLFRKGTNRLGNRLSYTWFPENSRLIQNHGFLHRLELLWNLYERKFESFEDTFQWAAQFRSGGATEVQFKFIDEWINEPFLVGALKIDSGKYRFAYGRFKLETSSGRRLRLALETQDGGYYEGRQTGRTIAPSWTLSPHLTLKLEYTWSKLKISSGLYNVHIARVRLQSALSPKLSANSFIQYNSDLRQISANIRLRYNPSEGVDLYIVYNEGVNTDLAWKMPCLPRTSSRTVFIKYTYTFIY